MLTILKGIMSSKTMWTNIVAALALFLQTKYGFVMSPEDQVALLAALNIILRFVTTTSLAEKGSY